ncbi:MAG: hypothetical protein HOA38_07000 [Candidatus Marinimicrobia bacterium]|nr:hypothetical protein [Candidatus Neomarinimicrobiota bacterium]
MIGHNHSEKMISMIQKHLGRDLGVEAKGELKKHISECPDCKVYVDSIEETVKFYRKNNAVNEMPSGVSERLFKVLELKNNSTKEENEK